MMPPAQWQAERVELAAVLDRPLDARVRLGQLQEDQERLVRVLQHGHQTGVDVLYDGEKIVGRRPDAQPVPATARELAASTHAMVPRLGLPALIIDVARDIAFMDELRHAGGQQARSPTRRDQLFAALVACATGIGYTRMAEASRFTERQLREAVERHLTIEHLAAADTLVCEAIRRLAQTSTLDLERISSSEGQRYPIIGRSAFAGFAAREAGFRSWSVSVADSTLLRTAAPPAFERRGRVRRSDRSQQRRAARTTEVRPASPSQKPTPPECHARIRAGLAPSRATDFLSARMSRETA